MESFGILIHAATRTCRKTPTPAPSQRTRFALSVTHRRSKRSSSAWYAFSRSTEYARVHFFSATLYVVLTCPGYFITPSFVCASEGIYMLKFYSLDKPLDRQTARYYSVQQLAVVATCCYIMLKLHGYYCCLPRM